MLSLDLSHLYELLLADLSFSEHLVVIGLEKMAKSIEHFRDLWVARVRINVISLVLDKDFIAEDGAIVLMILEHALF